MKERLTFYFDTNAESAVSTGDIEIVDGPLRTVRITGQLTPGNASKLMSVMREIAQDMRARRVVQ